MKKLLLILISVFTYSFTYAPKGVPSKGPEPFNFESFKEMVFQECKFPVIVCSQAILESGNFTSRAFLECNNPFGIIMYSVADSIWRFRDFDTWQESVIYYRDFQKRKYKGGDYFEFLEQLPYAMDTMYIEKVKRICSTWE